MYRVRCPQCQILLGLAELPPGGRVRCGRCGKVLTLRLPAEPNAPEIVRAPTPSPAVAAAPLSSAAKASQNQLPDWVAGMHDEEVVRKVTEGYSRPESSGETAEGADGVQDSPPPPLSEPPRPVIQELVEPPPVPPLAQSAPAVPNAGGKLWQIQVPGCEPVTISFDRVKAMAQAAEIGPETQVLPPGKSWMPAASVPLLARYLSRSPGAVRVAPLTPAQPTGEQVRCVNHPGEPASRRCRSCGKALCESCTEELKVSGRIVHLCLACEDQCDSLIEEAPAGPGTAARNLEAGRLRVGAHDEVYVPAPLFWLRIHTLPFYPLAGSGWLRLIGLWLLTICASLSVYALLLYAFFYAYMLQIIKRSAEHDERLPPFPELTDFFEDYILPFLRYLCVSFYGVLALLLYNMVLRHRGPLETIDSFLGVTGKVDPINWLLVALLVLYYPMVLMTIGVVEDLKVALNPWLIGRYIVAILPEYLLHYVAQLVLLGGWMLAGLVFAAGLTALRLSPDLRAIVHFFGLPFIAVYFQVLQYRLVGMLAAQSRHKLNWI